MNGGENVERERKFLINDSTFLRGLPSTRLVQGYLVITPKVELRVRTGPAGQVLTVKGSLVGIERAEQEFVLEERDLAFALLEACDGRVIVKTRHVRDIEAADRVVDHWVVDQYHADNEGLIVAEYEYPDEESMAREVPLPGWIAREVTHLPRYYAQNLSLRPYREWSEAERAE